MNVNDKMVIKSVEKVTEQVTKWLSAVGEKELPATTFFIPTSNDGALFPRVSNPNNDKMSELLTMAAMLKFTSVGFYVVALNAFVSVVDVKDGGLSEEDKKRHDAVKKDAVIITAVFDGEKSKVCNAVITIDDDGPKVTSEPAIARVAEVSGANREFHLFELARSEKLAAMLKDIASGSSELSETLRGLLFLNDTEHDDTSKLH